MVWPRSLDGWLILPFFIDWTAFDGAVPVGLHYLASEAGKGGLLEEGWREPNAHSAK